jgi:AraC-type DNA-binding domain-containing proteins
MNQTLCAIHPMNAPLRAFIENSIALQNSNVDRCMGYLLDLIDIAFSSIEERMDCGRANTGKLRFELCRDLIDRHLVDIDISVEWLSLETGVSKRQIQRDFFDHGTSFTSYVQRKRLLLAADILEQFIYSRTLPNISDVAFRVGFGDVSNFNRAFKRCFGVTPRDYLRSKTAESTVGRLAAQGLVHHRPT